MAFTPILLCVAERRPARCARLARGECHPQVDDYLLANGDQLLLCTDGLTDMVDDTEIELVLNSATNAKSACRSLIDLALGNGGRDNVTVIVARYSIPPVTDEDLVPVGI